jgi:hypothetical protein
MSTKCHQIHAVMKRQLAGGGGRGGGGSKEEEEQRRRRRRRGWQRGVREHGKTGVKGEEEEAVNSEADEEAGRLVLTKTLLIHLSTLNPTP